MTEATYVPQVLFVDDDEEMLGIYKTGLEGGYGFEVHTASKAEDALVMVNHLERPAAHFQDVHLGKNSWIDGIALMKKIVEIARYPLVSWYLSADPGPEAEAVRTAGYGFIHKPATFEKIASYVEGAAARLLEKELALKDDPLTGLLNRSGFLQMAKQELAQAHRLGGPVSLLFMDLNGFKQLNKRITHSGADKVLVAVGKEIKEHLRAIAEPVARIAGDEFATLLLSDERQARIVVQRLKERVAGLRVDVDGELVGVTMAVGIASAERVPPEFDKVLACLLKRGSEEMFKDKPVS